MFIARYRGAMSNEFHEVGCAALVGIITAIPLSRALKGPQVPCPSCLSDLAADGQESKDLRARLTEKERREAVVQAGEGSIAKATSSTSTADTAQSLASEIPPVIGFKADFRNARWGMIMSEVKSAEGMGDGTLILAEGGGQALHRDLTIGATKWEILYHFDKLEFEGGSYVSDIPRSEPDRAVDLYFAAKGALAAAYGPPSASDEGAAGPLSKELVAKVLGQTGQQGVLQVRCFWDKVPGMLVAMALQTEPGSGTSGPLQVTILISKSAEERTSVSKGSQRVVYVTRTGSRYHLKTCRHVSTGATALQLADARQRFSRCDHCRP